MPPGSVCITSLLDMTINLQLIMKNHPVIRIRISKAKVVKPNVRLIMIESKKSKADIYVRSYREHFGLCNYDSLLFFFCFSAIMFIFFMWVELFLGLTFLHPDTIVKWLPIPIHTHIRDTYYARVGCCKGECWLLNIFIIHFSIDWVENSIVPSRLVSRHSCRASYRVTVRGAQGSQSALVLFFTQLIA